MKLHENQLKLILHLIRLNIMAYEDCLKFLDTENTGDMKATTPLIFKPRQNHTIPGMSMNLLIHIRMEPTRMTTKMKITENAETNSPNVFVFFIVRLLPAIPESVSGKYL